MFTWFKNLFKRKEVEVTSELLLIEQDGFRPTYEYTIYADGEEVLRISKTTKLSQRAMDTLLETHKKKFNS
jgi:hypothetical protein